MDVKEKRKRATATLSEIAVMLERDLDPDSLAEVFAAVTTTIVMRRHGDMGAAAEFLRICAARLDQSLGEPVGNA